MLGFKKLVYLLLGWFEIRYKGTIISALHLIVIYLFFQSFIIMCIDIYFGFFSHNTYVAEENLLTYNLNHNKHQINKKLNFSLFVNLWGICWLLD
jgi:hypothetical protein